jgi:hypothetical protein
MNFKIDFHTSFFYFYFWFSIDANHANRKYNIKADFTLRCFDLLMKDAAKQRQPRTKDKPQSRKYRSTLQILALHQKVRVQTITIGLSMSSNWSLPPPLCNQTQFIHSSIK